MTSWPARPVLFQGTEPTNNGVDDGLGSDDRGRGAITSEPLDTGKFKVPSLRNVDLTGPYMHDGRFRSLERVIEHYSKGLRAHPNLDPRLRTGAGGGWRDRGRTPPKPTTPPVAGGDTPVTPGTPGTPVSPGTPGAPSTPTVPSTSSKPTTPGPAGPGTARDRPARPTPTVPLPRASQRRSKRGFEFNKVERKALLAFLKTLTDEKFVKDPKFSDPFR